MLRNQTSLYTGPVTGNLRRKNPRPVIKRKKTRYKCKGGPWHGRSLWLEDTPTTLHVVIDGQTGRYRGYGTDGQLHWFATD